MDTQDSLHTLFSNDNFGVRPINTISEFCCENLNKLSDMSPKDLDVGIVNLYEAMANLSTAHCVRLNVSKYILLHSICLHFLIIFDTITHLNLQILQL